MYFTQTWLIFPTVLARLTRVQVPAPRQRLKIRTPDDSTLVGIRIPSIRRGTKGAPTLLGFGGECLER
jgi:hypothetical protein